MGSHPPSRLSLPCSVANAPETATPSPTKHPNHFHPMCLPLPTRTSSMRSTTIESGNKSGTAASKTNPYDKKESRESPLRKRPSSTSSSQGIDLVWEDGSSAAQTYAGLEKDEELWLTDGDCLIFFEEKHRNKPPIPSFRVESTRIESIPFLKELLEAGKPFRRGTRRDTLGTSREALEYPNAHRLISPRRQLKRKSVGYLPLPTMVSPLKFPELNPMLSVIDQRRTTLPAYTQHLTSKSPERFSAEAVTAAMKLEFHEDVKNEHEEESGSENEDYEIWFAIPPHLNAQDQHMHKLAIRNLIAILHEKAIVGPNLLQSLTDVQCLLDVFILQQPLEPSGSAGVFEASQDLYPAEFAIPVNMSIVTAYIESRQFDDVRYDLHSALRLLAWSELPQIRWSKGYAESFAHVVGMMTSHTSQRPEFKELSQITRRNLENAFSALQLVVLEAEEKLRIFDFSQMWTLQKLGPSGSRQSFEAFRKFLVDFYTSAFKTWPPSISSESGRWLDRDIVGRLQRDLGALYDYLVNRDIHWDTMKACYRREWEMACDAEERFKPDEHVPVTDILVGFDDFHGLLHIPHPYPLLPVEQGKVASKKRFFPIFSRVKNAASRDEKDTLKASLAYCGATNINKVAASFRGTASSGFVPVDEFLESFNIHERSTALHGVSLQEARLGRWVLLYGILQVLSLVSVDVGGLRHTKEVRYLMRSSLQGCPAWRGEENSVTLREPSQMASYCWNAPDQWEEDRKVSRAAEKNENTGTLIRTSQATGMTDWEDTELGQNPGPSMYEGAAQAVPLQHGVREKLFDIGEVAIGKTGELGGKQ